MGGSAGSVLRKVYSLLCSHHGLHSGFVLLPAQLLQIKHGRLETPLTTLTKLFRQTESSTSSETLPFSSRHVFHSPPPASIHPWLIRLHCQGLSSCLLSRWAQVLLSCIETWTEYQGFLRGSSGVPPTTFMWSDAGLESVFQFTWELSNNKLENESLTMAWKWPCLVLSSYWSELSDVEVLELPG